MGKYAHVFGTREDDANAVDYILNQLEEKKPKAMIMGEYSMADMAYLKVGELAYSDPKNVEMQLKKVEAADVIARKKMFNYFNNQLTKTAHMYSETENEEFSGHADDAKDGDFRLY